MIPGGVFHPERSPSCTKALVLILSAMTPKHSPQQPERSAPFFPGAPPASASLLAGPLPSLLFPPPFADVGVKMPKVK